MAIIPSSGRYPSPHKNGKKGKVSNSSGGILQHTLTDWFIGRFSQERGNDYHLFKGVNPINNIIHNNNIIINNNNNKNTKIKKK